MNVDLKIISKALSEKLKKVLADLISSQQTAYVKNRHIGECGRLISDIVEIAKTKKIEGFLVTMDIEKAFDSLDHKFLIYALEKYDFGKNFIAWVNILLRNQESCVLNGSTTKIFSARKRRTSRRSNFSLFICFSLRNFISAHKIKNLRSKFLQYLTIATSTLHMLTTQPFSCKMLSL